ncbi:beta-phosphoglucomutase [Microbacterium sp. PMB16]|uniref:beta-phosphoglucomutase n=1 Tax=Microbacterium sp. PMB16 TaxID=3120157 RepID=UPI003F4BE30D
MNLVTDSRPQAAVFDLDGVLVDTAGHHMRAWQAVAQTLGISLRAETAESLKGVSRIDALRRVLDDGDVYMPPEQMEIVADFKNLLYRRSVSALGPDAVLPGVREFLSALAQRGIPMAVASASRSATEILERSGLREFFSGVVDGNAVAVAKPAPDVFIAACSLLGQPPEQCLVFEDAAAGVQGARAAGCATVGIGDPSTLSEADRVVDSFFDLVPSELFGDRS